MARARTYSHYTLDTLELLAKQIQLKRKQHKWSEHELARRAGISRATLQKIEKGDERVAIGLTFEVAVLVGVTLFQSDHRSLRAEIANTDQKLVLLPKSIHQPRKPIDDEF